MTTPRLATIDLITEYYRRFNLGDHDGFLQLLADDVRHDINQGASEVGVPAFRAFLARMNRCYHEQVFDLFVMADDTGTRAAAEFTIIGTYVATDEGLPTASNQTYRLPVSATFAIRGGAIARISNHYNLADWLRQIATPATR